MGRGRLRVVRVERHRAPVGRVAGPRPAHFLLTFLGAATGLIVLSRPMARDPTWQRLAGYALTTGIAILVVIPIHSLLALPADGPLHQ
jgi:hypothetical protein